MAAQIRVAFIYGSVAKLAQRNGSDVDVMVVGEPTFGEVVSAVGNAQETLAREVNPTVYSRTEAAHYEVTVGAGESKEIRLRLTLIAPQTLKQGYGLAKGDPFGAHFDEVMSARLQEANEFYASITPPTISEDAARVMRQAPAGMLWSKQHYYWDGEVWLDEHGADALVARSSIAGA